MKNSVLMAMVTFALCASVFGKAPRHPAVGEVHFDKSTAGGLIASGQCGLIAPDLIITAYHVLDHRDLGMGFKSKAFILFEGMEPIEAVYLAGDYQDDIALMRLSKPVGIDPLNVARSNAVPGDEIFLEGAKHRDTQHTPMICDPLTSGDIVSGSMHCWQGESGTVFLNGAGEIVGVLTGGWQICKDKDGKNIKRQPVEGGPITHKVYPTTSRSTADEIRELINQGLVDNKPANKKQDPAIDGTPKSPAFIREYRPGDLKKSGTHLLVLSAPWCNPCQVLKSNLKKWGKELRSAGWDDVIVVDADSNKGMRDLYQVKVFPTVVKIKDGKIVKRWDGVPSKAELVRSGK